MQKPNPLHLKINSANSHMPVNNELIKAYESTHYTIYAEPVVILHTGQHSEQLSILMAMHDAKNAAFITASNPYSKILESTENEKRHDLLCRQIEKLGYLSLPGAGLDPKGKWPKEKSLFIMGMSKTEAISIGKEFCQNAILWIDSDGIPQLVILQ